MGIFFLLKLLRAPQPTPGRKEGGLGSVPVCVSHMCCYSKCLWNVAQVKSWVVATGSLPEASPHTIVSR